MKKIFLAGAMMVGIPFSALAYGGNGGGWNIGLGLMYQSTKTETAAGSSESTQTDYDIKLGYLMSNGLYLGGIYSNRTTGGATSYPTRTGHGVVLGYHTGGWNFDVDYYLNSTHTVSAAQNYTGGRNLQLDIGYDVPMSSSFYIGWQMAYRMLAYTTSNTNGVASTVDQKYTELQPLIRMGFYF